MARDEAIPAVSDQESHPICPRVLETGRPRHGRTPRSSRPSRSLSAQARRSCSGTVAITSPRSDAASRHTRALVPDEKRGDRQLTRPRSRHCRGTGVCSREPAQLTGRVRVAVARAGEGGVSEREVGWLARVLRCASRIGVRAYFRHRAHRDREPPPTRVVSIRAFSRVC